MFIGYTSLQGLWKYKKRTLSILLVFLGLSIALTFVSSFKYIERATKLVERQERFGRWSYANFYGEISEFNDFDNVGTIYKIETSDEINFASFDESMFQLSSFKYYSGREPENNQEIIVELSSLNSLNAPIEIDQEILIKTNDGDTVFKLVGIIYDYSSEWLIDENQTYQYPSVITTDIKNENISQFAYSEKLPNLTGEQYLSNSLTYHQIDTETDAAELWTVEDELIELQSNELVNILLIISIFVIISVFKLSSSFYEEKVILLRTLGINKFEAFIYNLIHALFFAMSVAVTLFISLGASYVLLDISRIGQFEINYNLFKKALIILPIATFFIYLLMSSRSVVKNLTAGTIVPNKKTIKFNRLFLVILSILLSILLLTPLILPFFQVFEYHKPRINEMSKRYNDSKHYTIWGTIDEETKLLGKKEINQIKSMKGLKEITFYNVFNIYLENISKKSNMHMVEINQYNDEWLSYFEKAGIKLSDDFIEGNSVLFSKDYSMFDENKDISTGDKVLLNDEKIYMVEDIVDDDLLASVITEHGTNLSMNSILISENGIRRIGFNPRYYNVVNIRINSAADPLVYDVEISKLAQGQRLKNQRFYFETELTKLIDEYNFEILQMGAIFVIGFGIITNFFINEIMQRKRDIGMKKLLGFQNNEIIWDSQKKYVVPMTLGIIPSLVIGYELYIRKSFQRYLESPIDTEVYIDSLNVYRSRMIELSIEKSTFVYAIFFILGIIALIVAVNYIIIKHFVKQNPFDLIDEKE